MKLREASIIDVLGTGSNRDCCVILPTLNHALALWPNIIDAFRENHGKAYVVTTKTNIISRRTKTAVRLWVPYKKDATQPWDFRTVRRRMWWYEYMNLYGLYGGDIESL